MRAAVGSLPTTRSVTQNAPKRIPACGWVARMQYPLAIRSRQRLRPHALSTARSAAGGPPLPLRGKEGSAGAEAPSTASRSPCGGGTGVRRGGGVGGRPGSGRGVLGGVAFPRPGCVAGRLWPRGERMSAISRRGAPRGWRGNRRRRPTKEERGRRWVRLPRYFHSAGSPPSWGQAATARRRRRPAPASAKPPIIRLQVAGSGTTPAPFASNATSLTIVPPS